MLVLTSSSSKFIGSAIRPISSSTNRSLLLVCALLRQGLALTLLCLTMYRCVDHDDDCRFVLLSKLRSRAEGAQYATHLLSSETDASAVSKATQKTEKDEQGRYMLDHIPSERMSID